MPNKEYDITVEVRGKILKTAAESIYGDTSIRIREAVTNSIDNNATKFILTLRKNEEDDTYVLSLFDNGDGITVNRFLEILSHIGYSLHLEDIDPKKKYSHYGLGLMSIFELGDKVSVITKSKGTKNTTCKLVVESKKLFSKEMEKKSLSEYKSCFKLTDSSKEEREELSPMSANVIKEKLKNFPNSYTEFIVEGVTAQDVSFMKSDDFIESLRKTLPLKPSNDEPLLKSLKKEHSTTIKELLLNCSTIDFLCSIKDDNIYVELFKYFPSFSHIIKGNYTFYSGAKDQFSYYLIVGRKTFGTPDENKDSGLWFRSKNVLVKESDYLGYQGCTLICDAIVGKWIFGEVFHENMIDFIDATRNNFKVKHEDFREFREKISDIVSPICKKLRESYDKGHEIVSDLEDTYNDFKSPEKSPLRKLEEKIIQIEKLGEDEGDHVVKINKLLLTLSQIHSDDLEKCPDFRDSITETNPVEFHPEGMNDYTVRIDASVTESMITETEAVIPADIFNPFDYTLFGESYRVRYVKSDIRQAISFNRNTTPRKITINLTYPELLKFNISYIEVLGVLEYASEEASNSFACKYTCADNKVIDCKDCLDDMKRIMAETLGGTDRSKLFRPLFGV